MIREIYSSESPYEQLYWEEHWLTLQKKNTETRHPNLVLIIL